MVIGYWSDASGDANWPSPTEFVDPSWDPDERDLVEYYLQSGKITRAYMGYSKCRFCGRNNGDLELTDGFYVWPDGLAHYVADHGVRLPRQFVHHVLRMTDLLETAEYDGQWWCGCTPTLSEESS